ncbi:MAG TPA: Crp/Fnr family transcriptional regulator [Burkholderiales bacterium]|nr:Crp/Fnr family transcriptional regulator [Burkholderiales bacterium]
MLNGHRPVASGERRLIEGVVRNLPLFAGLAPGQLQSLAAACWTVEGARGSALVRTDQRLPGVCALAYGMVKLTLRNGGTEERLLRLVAARETFGEACALLGRPSPYDVVALAQVKLIVIPSASLLSLLEREVRVAKALVANLAEGHLELCAQIESATLQKGAQRLATYLSELAGDGAYGGECAVQLPFSKTLLAAHLGIKKETLSRLLRQLASSGVIAVSRRSILIRDRERLLGASGSD